MDMLLFLVLNLDLAYLANLIMRGDIDTVFQTLFFPISRKRMNVGSLSICLNLPVLIFCMSSDEEDSR